MRSEHPTNATSRTVIGVLVVILVIGFSPLVGPVAADDGDAQIFGVTAGADAQAPVDEDGDSALRLAEHDPNDFPTNGTAELTLPAAGDVRIDANASDLRATATGSSEVSIPNVTIVDDRTVTVDVANTSGNVTESLTLEGLRFVVPSDATPTVGTWRLGDASTAVRLEAERLDARLGETVIARGVNGAPSQPRILVDARDLRSSGFHASGERMAVYVPGSERDRFAFDTRSRPEIELFGEGCASETDSVTRLVPSRTDRGLTEHVFFFEVDCEIGPDNAVMISGLRFNTTGAGMDEPAEFDTSLVVESVPANATGPVAVDTEPQLSVVAPEVTGNGDTIDVPSNATGVNGDRPARVTVTDDSGGLIEGGSALVLALDGDGVTFDRSQELSAQRDGLEVTVESIEARRIVLRVENGSEVGDSVSIAGADGGGLAFNASADAEAARMGVVTSAGGDDVAQVTGTTISVGGSTDGDDSAVAGGNGGIGGPVYFDTDPQSESDDSDLGEESSSSVDEADNSENGTVRRPIEDVAPDQDGVTVDFDSVPVTSITFEAETDGDVSVTTLEILPSGLSPPPGETVAAVDIVVPATLADTEATLRFTVDTTSLDSTDPSNVTLFHYDDETDDWEPLVTELISSTGDTVVFEARSNGFSPFALQTMTEESGSIPTGTPDSEPTSPTDDDASEPAEVSALGGGPLVLLALGLVAVGTGGLLARRLR